LLQELEIDNSVNCAVEYDYILFSSFQSVPELDLPPEN